MSQHARRTYLKPSVLTLSVLLRGSVGGFENAWLPFFWWDRWLDSNLDLNVALRALLLVMPHPLPEPQFLSLNKVGGELHGF